MPHKQEKPPDLTAEVIYLVDVTARRLTEPEPQFTDAERKALRQMLREFALIKGACPTARREIGNK